MPDWFYRTVSRPVLFRQSAGKAQHLACRFIGKVGNLPLGAGGALIDFLGHMRPDPHLGQEALGRRFIGPVGLGIRLDGGALATNAWSRFGFSFLEVGPVTSETTSAKNLCREDGRETILVDAPSTISAGDLNTRLENWGFPEVHLIVRLKIEETGTPEEAAVAV